MNLVERVTNLLFKPKQEWPAIEAETTTPPELYKNYVMILAAIGPLASILGFSFIGMQAPLMGTVRFPLSSALTQALVSYVLTLAGVYVLALIIDALAPTFSGAKNMNQAFKVAAYASTAAWLGGIFTILPALSILGLLFSLYSLYLLYVGLPVLMKSPADKSFGYTAAVLVVAIVLFVVIGAMSMALTPHPIAVSEQSTAEHVAKQLELVGQGHARVHATEHGWRRRGCSQECGGLRQADGKSGDFGKAHRTARFPAAQRHAA